MLLVMRNLQVLYSAVGCPAYERSTLLMRLRRQHATDYREKCFSNILIKVHAGIIGHGASSAAIDNDHH